MVRVVKRSKAGKTLVVDVEFDNNRISSIVISGDFFAYPEEAVEEIEEELRNTIVDNARRILEKYRSKVELVGITIDDIIDAVLEAYRSVQRS